MLSLKSHDLKKITSETVVIPVCEDKQIHDSKILSSIISHAKKLNEFSGAKNDAIVFYGPSPTETHMAGIKARTVILLGLGKIKNIDAETFRAFAGMAVKKCNRVIPRF